MTKIKGFLPYILIIFFNSFVDLGHKILIQNTIYQTTNAANFSILSSIVNGLILLPYLFLFTPSGFIADRFPKVKVLRITAMAAIPLTMIATWSYFQGYFKMAFALTLLLAIQSAINSPAKYGYIKEIFGKSNIARANAVVQTTAIIAILSGTFVFSIIFNHYLNLHSLVHSQNQSEILKAFAPAGFSLIIMSIGETICTFLIPQKPAVDASSHYEITKYARGTYLKKYLQEIGRTPMIYLSIIGLAVFWGINQVLLASYGAYLKSYAGNPSALYVQGALAMGGVGVLLGATYAGKVSRGFIETGLIPFAAIGLSLSLMLLPQITNHITILILFLIYGFFGGILIVPLNSLIQFNAQDKHLGKVMASNNFVQNVMMFSFLVFNVIYTEMGGDIIYLLHALFVLALVATVFALLTLPQSLIRYLIYFMVSKFYNIKVNGLDNLPSSGGVLLLGNHTSFLDWALLQVASPRMIRFVMERSIYEKWYLKWILSRLHVIPISRGSSKSSLKTIHEALKQGDVVAIFPEGRLSLNGQMNIFKTGFERAAKGSGAVIIPFYLLGLWGSSSSYATSRYKRLTKIKHRKVNVSFGESLDDSSDSVTIKQHIMRLSISSWKAYVASLGTISEEWLQRVKQLPNSTCVIDSLGTSLTNASLLSTVLYMRHQFSEKIRDQKNIGILLPPGIAGIIANLSILCSQKTVVNLNFTMTEENLITALEDAQVKTIITARLFVKKLAAKGYGLSNILSKVNIIYIEDFKKPTTKLAIIGNFLMIRLLPLFVLKKLILRCSDNTKVAAILFSSGSESKPKGIELTHRNIMGNVKQISSIFNIKDNDVVLSSLPLFHAFGFTTTTIMPLVEGTPMICHADPTDAFSIGKLVYKYKVTVMCGTSTMFGIYCRQKKLVSQMFDSLRLLIAGAEKLSEKTSTEFKRKFNIDIYEGYGATEVAPVASCNLPNVLCSSDMHLQISNKVGTVGLPLPGTAFKIIDPDSYNELPVGTAGMVLIGGTQVMKGYLNNPLKTKEVLLPDGDITWYITGDKGFVDKDGYLTILDRYSRFAKIGGEMISLSLVEQTIESFLIDIDAEIMVVSIPDDKKGEKIIMLYSGIFDIDAFRTLLRENIKNTFLLPSSYQKIDELPKLGTGKKDYSSAKRLVCSGEIFFS